MRISDFYFLKEKRFLPFIIFIVGLIFRVSILITNKPLYTDEISVWSISKESINKITSGKYFDFVLHPPLYYQLIHYWVKISSNEIWLRIPSVIIASLSTGLIYISISKLFNRNIGLLASLFYATSSYHIIWATQLRVYEIVLFISLIFIFIYSKIIIPRKKYIVLFTLIGIIGFNFDNSFFWTYLSVSIHFLIIKKFKFTKTYLSFLLILLSRSIYLWKIAPELLLYPKNLTWIARPEISTLLQNIFIFFKSDFNGLPIIFYKTLMLFSLLFLFLIIKESFIKTKNRLLFIIVTYLPLFLSFLVSQKYPIFISRNISIVSLGLIVLLALSISRINIKSSMLILFMWIFVNFSVLYFYFSFPGHEDWNRASSYLKQRLAKDTFVAIVPNRFRLSFEYYQRKYAISASLIDEKYLIGHKDIITDYCLIIRKDDLVKKRINKNVQDFILGLPSRITLRKDYSGITIYCVNNKIKA